MQYKAKNEYDSISKNEVTAKVKNKSPHILDKIQH